jgi:phosphoglycolate phosphatase-like HAD superfamily hydrolase
MTDAEPSGEHDDTERSLLDVLQANPQGQTLSPPVASPSELPSHELPPPMFERLAAEVAYRVDGLSRIRIYGRSGQDQGGLDLIGWDATGITVYQVRRIEGLSPTALRKAVEDFAKPTVKKTGKPKARRFDAQRFVLVTGCAVHDRHVDDELVKLKAEYQGDLEIDLYDNTELSMKLRDRGPLVYGVFGPDWARAYCGYQPPTEHATPHGRAYLADPVNILGYTELLAQATQLDPAEPAAAAALYEGLALRLDASGFGPRAREMRQSQLAAHRKAEQTDRALEVAVDLALSDYDDGDLYPGHKPISTAAELVGSPDHPLPRILEALADWFESGYDLGPVTQDLTTLFDANIPRAIALLLAVAEQVVADDDPRDDPQPLLALLERRLPEAKGLENLRLACCVADLRVRLGNDPEKAFHHLRTLALGGHVDADQAAFIHRRRGRALAATVPDEAIESYRRAVLDASERGLGGDVRDALRSVAFLTDAPGGVQPMHAARSVSDRKRLINGVDRVVISALEAVADNKLPQALRDCHHWVLRERINGALMDEVVALRRYGDVYARAGQHSLAERALIRGGARKAARNAADEAGSDYVDLSPYLASRHLTNVQDAAAACLARQADYVPDEEVGQLCTRLAELVEGIGTERLFTTQASISALEALAAFGARLPESVALALLDKLAPLVEREPNHYRHSDDAMLALFETCARDPSAGLHERASAELVRCVEQGVDKAQRHLRRAGKSDTAVARLSSLAAKSNRVAIELLATWGIVTPEIRDDALRAVRHFLERPVGQPRSSWTSGEGVQEAAVKFRAVLKDSEPSAEVVELRDRLAEHLLQWAEDGYDVAESRSDAVHAIRILGGALPDAVRCDAFNRLITLHDNPQLSEMDQFHQESLDPLSRFRIDTGSGDFYAQCLQAAAALATSDDQWRQTQERIGRDLAAADLTRFAAANIARAAMFINDIKRINVQDLATHHLAPVRQVAVICWASDDNRNPAFAERFALDEDLTVRVNLAHALREIEGYGEVCAQLKHDTSRKVRDLIGSHPLDQG